MSIMGESKLTPIIALAAGAYIAFIKPEKKSQQHKNALYLEENEKLQQGIFTQTARKRLSNSINRISRKIDALEIPSFLQDTKNSQGTDTSIASIYLFKEPYICVQQALIDATSDKELDTIIAHEYGHLISGHSKQSKTRSTFHVAAGLTAFSYGTTTLMMNPADLLFTGISVAAGLLVGAGLNIYLSRQHMRSTIDTHEKSTLKKAWQLF